MLANSGEDDIVFSDSSDYAANIEKAEAVPRESARGSATEDMRLVDTPNTKTIRGPGGRLPATDRENHQDPGGAWRPKKAPWSP